MRSVTARRRRYSQLFLMQLREGFREEKPSFAASHTSILFLRVSGHSSDVFRPIALRYPVETPPRNNSLALNIDRTTFFWPWWRLSLRYRRGLVVSTSRHCHWLAKCHWFPHIEVMDTFFHPGQVQRRSRDLPNCTYLPNTCLVMGTSCLTTSTFRYLQRGRSGVPFKVH